MVSVRDGYLIALFAIWSGLPMVNASTVTPDGNCPPQVVARYVNKDYCTTGNKTVFKGGSTRCIVIPSKTAAKTSAATAPLQSLKPCTDGAESSKESYTSKVEPCPKSWPYLRNRIFCRVGSEFFWWNRKTGDICKLPAIKGQKTNVTICPTEVFRSPEKHEAIVLARPTLGIRTCTKAQLQAGHLGHKLCVDENSALQLNKPDGSTCRIEQRKLPKVIVVVKLDLDKCPTFGPPVKMEIAIAECPAWISKEVKKKGLVRCTYKFEIFLWDPQQRKVCRKIMQRLPRYEICSQEIRDEIDKILDTISMDIDTQLARFCTPDDLFYAYVGKEFGLRCYYRGDFYLFMKRYQEVCKLPQAEVENLRYFQWNYCPKGLLDILRREINKTTTRTFERKRRAAVSLTVVPLVKQPRKSEINEDLEKEIRDWVKGGLSMGNVSLENIGFREQTGTSRTKRAAKDTRQLTLQTSDSILVKFTLVVDSRQVQGINFAAELERSMKENAHKFGGPGGNFQIDPSSIQVQEEFQKPTSTSQSNIDTVYIMAIMGGTFGIIVFGTVLFLRRQHHKVHRSSIYK